MAAITLNIEIEFTAGAWTSVKQYVRGLRFKRGVGEDRRPYTSELEFELKNTNDLFTPGNTASAYWNQLVVDAGVRFSTTYSGTTRYHFRGVISDIKPVFSTDPQDVRVRISCRGLSSLLSRQTDYPMELQASVDVDNAAAAIMAAAGSSLYSFTDSEFVVPYVYPRSDALSDIVAVWQSDPNQILIEDGQGRLASKAVVGTGYTPAHTWGDTIVPDGDIEPDWRQESRFSRQVVNLASLTPGVQTGVQLYRHPFNIANGYLEQLGPRASRTIAGTFEKMPLTVSDRYGLEVETFEESGYDLWGSLAAEVTTITLFSPFALPKPPFKPFDDLLVDNEKMLVTAAVSTKAGTSTWKTDITVERGTRGTTAATHTAGAAILVRPSTAVYVSLGSVKEMTAYDTTVTFSVNSGGVAVSTSKSGLSGSVIRVGDELMTVSGPAAAEPTPTWDVSRGAYGTAAVSHSSQPIPGLNPVSAVTFSYQPELANQSFIQASVDALGNQLSGGLNSIIGAGLYASAADIYWEGNAFVTEIFNAAYEGALGASDTGIRYLVDLVITGSVLEVKENSLPVAFEWPLPGQEFIREGPAIDLPFGAEEADIARCIAQGGMRVGRTPTPWIQTPPFIANHDDNVTSMLTAELGDLVRWTGTGAWREEVDEYYRILAIDGEVSEDNQSLSFRFELAPAHTFRDGRRCWYSEFSWGQLYAVTADVDEAQLLGRPEVQAPGLGAWVNVNASSIEWQRTRPVGHAPFERRGTAIAAGNTPAPALLNAGRADMVVAVLVEELDITNPSAATYPSGNGGAGLVFRSNSSGTNHWHVFYNRSTEQIILWNTNGGGTVVATASWPVSRLRSAPYSGVQYPELEVRCQGNRIRVYADCLPEPVIDATSSTFNTNTYLGIHTRRTLPGGGAATVIGALLKFQWLYGQAL